MRKRAHTVSSEAQLTFQQLRVQYQKAKFQLSALNEKVEDIQKQKDLLKQGNTKLISDFLFNKNKEEIRRLNSLLTEKQNQNAELKRIISDVERILLSMEKYEDRADSSSSSYHSSKYQVQGKDEMRKSQFYHKKSPHFDLKQRLLEFKKQFQQQRAKNSQLQEENFSLGQQLELFRDKISQIKCQIQTPREGLQTQGKEGTQKGEIQRELILKNSQLAEKIKQTHDLKSEISKLKNQIDDQKQFFKRKESEFINEAETYQQKLTILSAQLKRYREVNPNQKVPGANESFLLKPTSLNEQFNSLSISICQTQDMKKSIIYEKLGSDMQESIVTESYDKRVSKLQKVNASLEKDYKTGQQKIKLLNREYSKLKLDYLKVGDQWKKREDEYEKKIQSLNAKIEGMQKKAKEQESQVAMVKKEKQREKSALKDIILQLESKQVQSEQRDQKYKLEISELKEQIQAKERVNEKNSLTNSQLEHERNRYRLLEKQLQTKTKQFQRCLKEYQTMVEGFRKISGTESVRQFEGNPSDQRSLSKGSEEGMSSKRSLSRTSVHREKSRTNINRSRSKGQVNLSTTNLDLESLVRTLRGEVQALEVNLKLQNERSNVLENSNKELRKQLIKMIEQEEKLRKDLVAERIKVKTKSISSINSRNHMSSSKRLREEFGEENQPNSYLEGRLNRSMRYNSMSQSSLRGNGLIKGQGQHERKREATDDRNQKDLLNQSLQSYENNGESQSTSNLRLGVDSQVLKRWGYQRPDTERVAQSQNLRTSNSQSKLLREKNEATEEKNGGMEPVQRINPQSYLKNMRQRRFHNSSNMKEESTKQSISLNKAKGNQHDSSTIQINQVTITESIIPQFNFNLQQSAINIEEPNDIIQTTNYTNGVSKKPISTASNKTLTKPINNNSSVKPTDTSQSNKSASKNASITPASYSSSVRLPGNEQMDGSMNNPKISKPPAKVTNDNLFDLVDFSAVKYGKKPQLSLQNNSQASHSAQNGQKQGNDKGHKNAEQIATSFTSSSSYVYKPPKRHIPSVTIVKSSHQETVEETGSVSNKEITLQLSSSRSNLSRNDRTGEFHNPIEGQAMTKSVKQPQSASKAYSKREEPQEKGKSEQNGILSGKTQQTKSSAQVRFSRKT